MAVAGCCGRVFGWGLPALVLGTLLGAFSITLNGLQTLNGLFCFDTVRSESRLTDIFLSSFVSGYGYNLYYNTSFCCSRAFGYVTEKSFPFCNLTLAEDCNCFHFCNVTSKGFSCGQSIIGKGVVESYSYTVDVNCYLSPTFPVSFMISLTPGSSSMSSTGEAPGFSAVAVVSTNRCALSQIFYIVFSSVCAAITITIFVIRAWMRTCLVGLSFKLSQSKSFNWVYEGLEKQGFFNFENPYRNEPYHLVEGEKFYVMMRGKGFDGDTVGDTVGSKVDDTDSLAWSSAHSVYKFTYAKGEVFAYCKDRCGLETFVKANIKSSVASVIKEYLKQKSRSVCVTNDAKTHFLSLTECCELAQKGYELVEEISDGNYRMFYWSPRPQSHPLAQAV